MYIFKAGRKKYLSGILFTAKLIISHSSQITIEDDPWQESGEFVPVDGTFIEEYMTQKKARTS